MTELIIDGIQAVLPQSFTIQVKRENPLITKNGEYTYDVTLDLSNPVNAELYKHLNRLNSVAEVTTRRSAVLIADNRVYCNGTEVITGWTDKTVTIQIASGNSELNYIIGGDRLISSLTDMPDTDPAVNSMLHMLNTYPVVQHCLAAVYDESLGELCNAWGVKNQDVNPQVSTFNAGRKFSQPFLLPYIRAVISSLGYTLVSEIITGTACQKLYIVQTAHESKWCEMLPKWTVTEFLEQIEYLFNAIFVIDNRKKTVALMSRPGFFMGQQSVHIRNVDDIYEAEVIEEPDIEDMADANVSFKTDDTDFWRFHTLSDSLRDILIREDIPADYDPDGSELMRLERWFNNEEHQNPNKVYYDAKTGLSLIYTESVHIIQSSGHVADIPTVVYKLVDDFAPLIRENGDTEIELEIGPATFRVVELPIVPEQNPSPSYTVRFNKVMVPTVVSSNAASDNDKSLAEMIANNSAPPTASKMRIQLAFYAGPNLHLVGFGRDRELIFPVPFIDKWTYSIKYGSENDVYNLVMISDNLHTMHLSSFDMQFYQGGYDIDFKHGIKLSSYDPNVYNPRQVFEIRNKRYICAEIEYTLDANGRKGAWTGTFYPIRISDTEADARWILTDGKWRDGGVWLDNGRWLDE